MDVILRNVKEGDIKDFAEVYKSAYEGMEEYAYRKNRSIKGYFRWLYGRDKNGFFVAEINGEAVAFIACDSKWNYMDKKMGEIHEIVVRRDYKGKGIGRKLIEKAENYLMEKGSRRFGLWVGERNFPAIKFYEKMGYERKGKIGIWIRMEKGVK